MFKFVSHFISWLKQLFNKKPTASAGPAKVIKLTAGKAPAVLDKHSLSRLEKARAKRKRRANRNFWIAYRGGMKFHKDFDVQAYLIGKAA